MAFTLIGLRDDAVLVLEAHAVARAQPRALGHVRVHPHLVLAHRLGEDGVRLGAAERVDGGAAEEQPEGAGRPGRRPLELRHGVEAGVLQLDGVELDLLRRRREGRRHALLVVDGRPGPAHEALLLQLREAEARALQPVVEVLLDRLPGVEGLEAELHRELAGDPPVRLLVGGRLDDRLPQRHERLAEELDVELLVPLEVRGLGQHDVGPARDLAADDVHDDQQVEGLDGLDRLRLVRQGLDQVRRVDQPALHRVGLAR